MARILSDKDLRSLFGTALKNADESCLRPNSYVLRLGAHGEFLNTGKEFDLSKTKKGIKIHPGHPVGVTAHEELDFRRDTVHNGLSPLQSPKHPADRRVNTRCRQSAGGNRYDNRYSRISVFIESGQDFGTVMPMVFAVVSPVRKAPAFNCEGKLAAAASSM